MQTKEELQAFIAANEAKVAEFQSLGGRPRPLTADENRLAVTDPDAFEEILADRQDEVLDGMRLVAQFTTAQTDLAVIEAAEAEEHRKTLESQRSTLLEARYEQAAELEAALGDLNASLTGFLQVNSEIAKLDRQLGEQDRHRASHGLVALHLKRGLHQVSPNLARMAGIPFTPSKPGRTLAEYFRPLPDPLD